MAFRKNWFGRIASTGMGWNLRKALDGTYIVHATVEVTDAPAAHMGRRVDVEMTPDAALSLAESLTRAAMQARTLNEQKGPRW